MFIKEKINPVKLAKCFTTAPIILVVLIFTCSVQVVSAQEKSELDVPFAIIENSPVYPGCNENGTSKELKKCLSQNVTEFVTKNFNIKSAKESNLKGMQKIDVLFKIDKEGNVTGIRARAQHAALKEEAIRVIRSLPKMKPGIHKGKKVTVPYSLPIQFMVK